MRAAALLGLLLLTAAAPAAAQQSMLEGPGTPLKTREELVRELDRGSTPDKLYAARELRRQAREAARGLKRGQPGSMRAMEARETMSDLRRDVPVPAAACLSISRVRGVCADILRIIEAKEALPALSAAAQEPGRGRRSVREALMVLGEGE